MIDDESKFEQEMQAELDLALKALMQAAEEMQKLPCTLVNQQAQRTLLRRLDLALETLLHKSLQSIGTFGTMTRSKMPARTLNCLIRCMVFLLYLPRWTQDKALKHRLLLWLPAQAALQNIYCKVSDGLLDQRLCCPGALFQPCT